MSAVQLHTINTNLLVALDALLKTSSVTGAAKRLGVSPSAVSHSLRQLRELLDDPLLVRTQRGLRPTERAKALGPPLARALNDLELALGALSAFDLAIAQRRFVVAAPDFIGTELLTRVIDRTWKSAPGLDLDLLPSARNAEGWRLENGEIDLLVGALLDPATRTLRQDLYDERFVVIARRDHPDIQGSVSLKQFAQWPHALVGIDDRYVPERSWVATELAKHGLARRVAIRERYFIGVANTVASTDLISPVPHTLASWAQRRFGVQVLAPPIALPQYVEQMVWHPRSDRDPAHAWLRERITEAARDMAADRPQPVGPDWEGPVPHIAQD